VIATFPSPLKKKKLLSRRLESFEGFLSFFSVRIQSFQKLNTNFLLDSDCIWQIVYLQFHLCPYYSVEVNFLHSYSSGNINILTYLSIVALLINYFLARCRNLKE